MFEVFGLGAEFTFDASGTERISDIVGNLQRLSSQMALSTQDVQSYSNSLGEFSNVLTDMGKQMVVAGIGTTTAALYGVGKAAAWQTQMIDATRYMTDDSAESQTRYNQTLKETAQLLGTNKKEINAAAISYMQMGKSEDDALRLAKNAGYAGVAWDIAADEVSESFKSIKAAFNINLEDQNMYQKYLDSINEVGNSTAATSKDVVRFLAAGGAALHNTSKVTIEQAMGMASGMAAATLPVGEFSTMMIRLGNNFAKGKLDDNFKKLKVATKDSSGELRSFADVLYDVQKQWNTLDDATKSSFLTNTGGVYADRLALYMGVGEEYQKGTKIAQQDNSGSAEAEFNRVTDTFEFAIAKFKVTLDDFSTAFWGTLLPPLTKFVKGVDMVVSKISDFMQAHPIVMKVASSFILLAGVAMTLGGIFLLLNGFITKIAQAMLTGNTITVAFTNLFRGLGIVYRTLGPQIAAVTARFLKLSLTMGMMHLAWKYDLFNIRTLFEDFSSNINRAVAKTHDLLSDGMSVKKFNTNIQKLNDSDSVFDKLILGATKVGMAIKGIGEYITDGALSEDTFQKLYSLGLMPFISIVLGLGMRLKALFGGIKDGFITTITTISNSVKTVLGPIFTWLRDNVLLPVAKALFGVDENVETLSDAINSIQFVDLDALFGPIETWEKVGKVIGVVGGALLTLFGISKGASMISLVVSAIGGMGGAFGRFGGIIAGLFGILGRFGGSGANGGLLALILSRLFGRRNGNGGGGNGFQLHIPNPKTILKGLADIAIILGGFTIIVEAYGAMSTIPGFNVFMERGIDTLGRLFSNVGEMAIGIGILTLLTSVISNINPSSLIKGLADIAIILGGFTILFEAFGLLTTIPGFTAFLGNGASLLTTLFNAMTVFGSPSFILMTGAIAIMGVLSPATFLSGMIGLATILGGFTILIAAFGALQQIPGFTTFMDSGAETLARLFEQIGTIVGSLVGGVAEGITNSLPTIGQNLAGFAENVRPFFEILSTVPLDGIGNFMTSFGSFMLMMAGDSIASIFTGGTDLVALGSELSSFAESAKGFFDLVSTYPEAGLTKAPRVFESISNLGGYATKSGGLAQLFTGTTDLTQLGNDLSSFATSARTFYVIIATYPEAGLAKAPRVFESISNLGGYATKSGGFAQLFTGVTDLAELGKGLSTFGTNAKVFYDSVATYPESGITKASLVFESISNLGGYATKSGGLAQLFTGTTDLPELGNGLTKFAEGAKGFFMTVATFPDSAMEHGKQIFEVLNSIGSYDFKSGGIAQWFTGSTDLEGIGEQLTDFGGSVKGFFTIAGALDYGAISKGSQIFDAVAKAGDGAFRSGGIVDVFTGGVDIVNIGKQLTSFGVSIEGFFQVAGRIDNNGIMNASRIFASLEGVGKFAESSLMMTNLGSAGTELTNFINNAETFFTKAATLDTSGVKNLVSLSGSLKTFFDVFRIVSASTISGLANSMTQFGNSAVQLQQKLKQLTNNTGTEFKIMTTTVTTETRTLRTNVETEYKTMDSSVRNTVTSMMNGVSNGIRNGVGSATSASSSVVTAIKSQFNVSLYQSGANMISGFVSGMRSKMGAVASAASDVTKTAKNYVGFNSPSKMGEGRHIVEWGYNMISGFAGGINDAQGLLESTVANVITNPMQDVLNNNANLPISAQSNVTTNETLNVSNTLGIYLSQIVLLLTSIAEVSGGIIRSDIDTPNGTISSQNIDATKQSVSETEKLVAETRANSGQLVVNIENGAIQNSYQIDGKDVDEQKIMALINLVMDEQLLPLLLDKINDLKIALNE